MDARWPLRLSQTRDGFPVGTVCVRERSQRFSCQACLRCSHFSECVCGNHHRLRLTLGHWLAAQAAGQSVTYAEALIALASVMDCRKSPAPRLQVMRERASGKT